MIRDWEPRLATGKNGIKLPFTLTEDPYYHVEDLLALKAWVKDYGLTLYSIMDTRFTGGIRAKTNTDSHQQHINNIKKSIVNMGEAGIPHFVFGSSGPAE